MIFSAAYAVCCMVISNINSKILQQLKKAVCEGEDELAHQLAKKALKEDVPPIVIINQAIMTGIQEAGELWKKNIYFLPNMVMSIEAFQTAMDVIQPHLSSGELGTTGNIVIGTVAGDVHSLGKKIVIAMLRSEGFDVIDLGEDVSISTFVVKVKELKPDILGLGCYMTTTMLAIGEVIKNLKDQGLRNDIKIVVGGVCTSQKFADDIGADAWGKDAIDAVKKAKQLVQQIESSNDNAGM